MARQSGFTIIEVLLFLAVSGLLFMIAVGSLNTTIRATRFTDATNGLENFISQQYSDVRSGVSYRSENSGTQNCGFGTDQAPGASDGCIVVGRLLDFVTSPSGNRDTINTYNIVATKCPNQNAGLPLENGCPSGPVCSVAAADTSDAAKLATYCPRVLGSAPLETYQIPWGVFLPATVGASQNPRIDHGNGSQPSVNRIAIIHSPTSERIHTFAYSDTSPLASASPISASNLVGNTANRNVLMCLQNPGIGSAAVYQYVSIGAGQSSDLVTSGAARDPAQMPGEVMGCQ